MELNNMTGDPNQETPPSVFRFDAYPGPNNSLLQWDTMPQEQKHLPHSSFYSRLPGQSGQNPMSPQIPSTFAFSSPPYSSPIQGQFPFQITNQGSEERTFRLCLGKRKTDSPPLQSCKQHITEEKMAEHMSKLHISSETVSSPLEPETVKNKRLYMCEEMRKLQNDPIIPPSLVSQLERPCTALVLWQPPLRILPCSDLDADESNNENKEDLNSNTPETKSMEATDMDSESSNTMETDA